MPIPREQQRPAWVAGRVPAPRVWMPSSASRTSAFPPSGPASREASRAKGAHHVRMRSQLQERRTEVTPPTGLATEGLAGPGSRGRMRGSQNVNPHWTRKTVGTREKNEHEKHDPMAGIRDQGPANPFKPCPGALGEGGAGKGAAPPWVLARTRKRKTTHLDGKRLVPNSEELRPQAPDRTIHPPQPSAGPRVANTVRMTD